MARTYADMNQYLTWAGLTTSDIPDVLFPRASGVVDEVLIGAVYQVDDDQMPTDARIKQALADATCAQAQWMDAVGDTTGAGDTLNVKSASIGSVSFSKEDSGASVGKTPSGADIAPGMERVLRVEGLLPTVVRTRG